MGYLLMQRNEADYQTLFVRGRSVIIFLALVLGWLVYRWATELYGPAAGLVALDLFAFSPDMLAHGHLVTLDMAGALGFTLTAYATWRMLERERLAGAAWVGVAFGVASLLKLSGFVLGAAGALTVLARFFDRTQSASAVSWRGWLARLAVMAGTGLLVINAGYVFDGSLTLLSTARLDPNGLLIMGLYGGTFHHVANLLLRQHCLLAGYQQGFSILYREDSRDLFDACIAEVSRKETVLPKGNDFSEISSLAKNTGREIGDIVIDRFPHFADAVDSIERISVLYEKKKHHLNLMDFDDLLVNWKGIFTRNEKIREFYSLKFRHILVDEYQDTNRLQADIIDLTAGGSGNLKVVGDHAQSIYSFRGADFENIHRLPEKYRDTSVFKLTTNYRSTPEILYLANRIIANNRKQFRKELHAVVAGRFEKSLDLLVARLDK